MNRLFKVIFNRNKCCYEVVSELARSCGRCKSSVIKGAEKGSLAAAVLLMLSYPLGPVNAAYETLFDSDGVSVSYDEGTKKLLIHHDGRDTEVDGRFIISGGTYDSSLMTITYNPDTQNFTVVKKGTAEPRPALASMAAAVSNIGISAAPTAADDASAASNVVYDSNSNSVVILNSDGSIPSDSGNGPVKDSILLNPSSTTHTVNTSNSQKSILIGTDARVGHDDAFDEVTTRAGYSAKNEKNGESNIVIGNDARVITNYYEGPKSSHEYKKSVIGTAKNRDNNTVIGNGAMSSGRETVVLGFGASTVVDPDDTNAYNDYAVAIGSKARSQGYGSVAIGYAAQVTGYDSIVIGSSVPTNKSMYTLGLARDSVVIGSNSIGFENTSISVGRRNLVGVPNPDLITQDAKGYWILKATAIHDMKTADSVAVGTSLVVPSQGSVALGKMNYAKGTASTAVGKGVQALSNGAIAIGQGAPIDGVLPDEYWKLDLVDKTNIAGDVLAGSRSRPLKKYREYLSADDPGGFRVIGENAVGIGSYGQVRGDGAVMIASGAAPFDASNQKAYEAENMAVQQAKLDIAAKEGVLEAIEKQKDKNSPITDKNAKDLAIYLEKTYGIGYDAEHDFAGTIADTLSRNIVESKLSAAKLASDFRKKWLEGKYSFVEGEAAVGLGRFVQVHGDRALAIGDHAIVGDGADKTADDAIAMGGYAKVTGKNSLVFGFGGMERIHMDGTAETLTEPQFNLVSGARSILLGSYSKVLGDNAFGIGNNLSVDVDYGISLGDYSSVSGAYGLNFGYNGTVDGKNGINIGSMGKAATENALNFGTEGMSSGTDSINIGTEGRATMNNAISIGYRGQATGDSTIALGGFSIADHDNSIAIGANGTVHAVNSASVGVGSAVMARNSLSLGNSNAIAINRSIPLGVLADDDIAHALTTAKATLDNGGVIASNIAEAQKENDAAKLQVWTAYKQEAFEAIGKDGIAAQIDKYQKAYDESNAVSGAQRDEDAIAAAKKNLDLWMAYQQEVQPLSNVTAIGTAAEFKALRDKLLGDNFIADERRLTPEESARYRILAAKRYDVPLHDVVALGNNITETTLNSVFLGNKAAYVSFNPENVTPAQPLLNADGKNIIQADGTIAYTPVADEGNTTRGIDTSYTNEVVYTYRRNKDGQIEIIRVSHDFAGARNVVGVVSVGGEVAGYDQKTIKVTDPETGQIVDKTVKIPIVATRRIQNVAPGLLSPTSSDAVNGSQLYALGHVVGNLATSVADQIGPNTTITEDGKVVFDDEAYGIGGTKEAPTHAYNLVDFINMRRIELRGDTDWHRGKDGQWQMISNSPGMAEIHAKTTADGHTVYEVHVDQFMDTQARNGNTVVKAEDNYWYETAELEDKTYIPEENKWYAKADAAVNERQADGKWYAKADIQDKAYVNGKWYNNSDLGKDGKTFYESDQNWYNTSDMVNGKPAANARPVAAPDEAAVSEAAVVPVSNPNKAVLENVLIDPNNHTPTLLNGIESLFETTVTGNGVKENTELGDIGLGTNTFIAALNDSPAEKSHYAATVGDLKKMSDTPLFFSGNAGTADESENGANTFPRKLSQNINIVGDIELSKTDAAGKAKELAAMVTNGNIGVVSDGKETLTIKMASDLKGLHSITTTETSDDGTTRTTVVNGSGVETNGHVVMTGGSTGDNTAPKADMIVVQGMPGADSAKDTGTGSGSESSLSYMDRIQYTDSASKAHQVATLDDGWFLQANGNSPVSVKLNDTVQLKDGINAKVSPIASKGGIHTFQINVTGLPLVFSDNEGSILTKIGDVYYREEDIENGSPKPGADAISPNQIRAAISLVGADGSRTNPLQLENLGSGLMAKDGSSVLLSEVTDDNPVWNNAVNVGDLKNAVASLTTGSAGGGFGLTGNDWSKAVMQDLGNTIAVQGGMTDSEARTDVNTYVSVQERQGKNILVVEMAKNLQDLTSLSASQDVSGSDGQSVRQTTILDGNGVVIRTETQGDNPTTTVHTKLTEQGLETTESIAIAGGGKDGPAAVLNKDEDGAGHIILQGSGNGGEVPKADILVSRGDGALNNNTGIYEDKPYMDRLQYTDSALKVHRVATLDDGFILDTNGNNKKKVFLNQTVNVVDGVNTAVSEINDNEGIYSFHVDVTGLPMEYVDADGQVLVRIGDTFYTKNSIKDGSASGATEGTPVNIRLTEAAGRGEGDVPTLTQVGSGRRSGARTDSTPWEAFFDSASEKTVAPMLTNGANIGDVKAAIEYIAKAGTGTGETGGFGLKGNNGTVRQDLGSVIAVRGGMDDTAKRTDENTYVSVQGETKELVVELAKDLKGLTSVTTTGENGTKTVLSGTGVEASRTTKDEQGSEIVEKTALTAGGVSLEDGKGGSYTASADGSIIRDAEGNQTETNSGGIVITAAGHESVSLTETGLNNGGNQIQHVASGLTDENGKAVDDLSKAVDTNAVNVGDLKSVYNALTTNLSNTVNTQPLTFKGDSGAPITRKLGDTLAIKGGAGGTLTSGNIGVVSDGSDTLNIELADTLTGLKGITSDTITANSSLTVGKEKDQTTILGSEMISDKNGSKTTISGNQIHTSDASGNHTMHIDGDRIIVQNNENGPGGGSKSIFGSDQIYHVDGSGNEVAIQGDTITARGKDNQGNMHETEINQSGVASSATDQDGTVVRAAVIDDGGLTVRANPLKRQDGTVLQDSDGNPVYGTETHVAETGVVIVGASESGRVSAVSLTADGLNNGGNRITNVAPGVDATDAVNVSQLHGMESNLRNEIGDVGAASAALAGLKPIQYDPLEPTQLMAAAGTYRGKQSVALGIAHYKNEDLMFHFGATIGSAHTMANIGVTYKFGSHDEKKVIPERYKAGPISSAYVMQDEITALKAENARMQADGEKLSAAYSELNEMYKKVQKDNEEIKRQLAYLMERVKG